MPPARSAPPQRQANGMMRTPQSAGPPARDSSSRGRRRRRRRGPHRRPPRRSTSPRRSPRTDVAAGQSAGQPAPTSAATIGNHRAIDALSHVGVKSAVKMPSQRGWRHLLYMLTRINLGLSPDELYEMDLHTRIRRNARDSYQIGVFGLKGGVGKTAVTVSLGSALSKVRGDRILADRCGSGRRQPRRPRGTAVGGDDRRICCRTRNWRGTTTFVRTRA